MCISNPRIVCPIRQCPQMTCVCVCSDTMVQFVGGSDAVEPRRESEGRARRYGCMRTFVLGALRRRSRPAPTTKSGLVGSTLSRGPSIGRLCVYGGYTSTASAWSIESVRTMRTFGPLRAVPVGGEGSRAEGGGDPEDDGGGEAESRDATDETEVCRARCCHVGGVRALLSGCTTSVRHGSPEPICVCAH
ncbi:hypothetical protein FA95DRAFT_67287 [Auriscalpium vulgare]|uniref:Uncharacterized protein n=1 Tax=Auriscalpium vulgare TaxID=40419 RepID=A0ACB8S8C9_9AGAM|nr:hypothetical protein FA95DRAFT_67287 [Auriscalpium vulgare]